MRWRRLKFSMLQASVHDELEGFLNERLDYEAYAEDFAEALAEILMEILQESPQKDLAEEAKELAHQYARSQPDAVKRVRLRLTAAELDADQNPGPGKGPKGGRTCPRVRAARTGGNQAGR
jgi:hypothetical protein